MFYGATHGYEDFQVADLGPSAAPCQYRISPADQVPSCSLTAGGGLTFEYTRISLTPAFEVKLHIGLAGDNPCIASCSIDASIDIWFRQRCQDGILSPLEFRASGQHDGFPWHEIYLNGQAVYVFDVFDHNTGPFTLCPPFNQWLLDRPEAGLAQWQPVPGQ